MRKSAPLLLAIAAVASTPLLAPVHAQPQSNNHPVLTNVIPDSESATLQATITGINPTTREVSLRGRSGETVTVTAGPAVRLDLLKTDDKVTVQYYRSVAFMVRPPSGGNGTPVNDSQMTQLVAQSAQTPGGIGVRLTKVSGTVVGIDMAANRVNLVNPSGGGVYTIDVTNPSRVAMLGSIKVGDTITAVISQAVAVSIEPAQKNWF